MNHVVRISAMLAAAIALVPCAAYCQTEQASEVSVRDYGAAGDGTTDDTRAFHDAMAAVAARGGTVKVPVGNYMIKTHLTVPAKVTLEGIWRIPTAWTANEGSTLLAVEGEGSEEGPPFITLAPNSTIKGITVFYPNQKPDDIKPYPWCVASGGGDNMAIIDCLLVNPYQAVDFGTRPSGRHYIRGLYGMPLRRGIFVDNCLDVGRIENVHFWPFWTWDASTGIQEWLRENGEAFIFARTDWEYVFNTFCFGYKIGYRFIETKNGAMNGNLLGIGADATNISVLVEQCQKPGLLITNGEFVAFGGERPTEIVVKGTNSGIVQFQNCSFWGPAYQIARIAGTGYVSFNNCNFLTWGYGSTDWQTHDTKAAAIEQFGGKLTVMGCNFAQAWPQLAVRGESVSTVFAGNQLEGPLQVTNSVDADLQVGLNAAKNIVLPPPPKRPTEEKGAIVVDDSDGEPAVVFGRGWNHAEEAGHYYRGTRWAARGRGESVARFRPHLPKTGRYDVFVFVGPDPMNDHASEAPVTVTSLEGSRTVSINLRENKERWRRLGTFRFAGGKRAEIIFTDQADGNVLADAVKLVPAR